jgi:hypothetical protein
MVTIIAIFGSLAPGKGPTETAYKKKLVILGRQRRRSIYILRLRFRVTKKKRLMKGGAHPTGERTEINL